MLVGLHNININRLPPMSIRINNKLPCVNLKLGYDTTMTPSLHALVDSGAAMNIRNKYYHRRVMSQFPDIVAEYLECGPGTNYDLVKLKLPVT